MQKIGTMKPYKITGPVTIEIEHTSRSALDVDMALHPEAEIIDARTVRYHGKDFLEAWTMARRH
jgi:D-aminopeptidase